MRKCEETDLSQVLEYLSAEPEINLFLYGDIEVYGISSDAVSVYVSDCLPDSGHPFSFLILQYYDNYLLYSHEENYAAEAAAAFLKERTIESLRGKTSLLRKLQSFFPEYSLRSSYLCRCNRESSDLLTLDTTDLDLRLLLPEDSPSIISLYTKIQEFSKTYQGKEEQQIAQTAESLRRGSLAYGLFCDNALVSIACTTAANSVSAMVVGVATLPGFRCRGYGTAVVRRLCDASFAQGKAFLCLTYDNPRAGAIYQKIGFEEIGEYALLR